ncbi:hypothetical protein C8Q79DRAFT_1003897 [Trametes meyenii]|nr:hypothetical protein C8Q79DRAFT_1003897 [Trametes meyenii]
MPSYTEDTASDSSFEDGHQAQSVPLLPFQSRSPGALKETFSSPTTPAWTGRLPLPPVVRRRCVLLTFILLGTLGGVPFLLSSRLNPVELEHVPPTKADINPPLPVITLQPAVAEEVVSAEDDALPVHLRPDTYLEGLSATAHFRDSLRNDTGYMTSFLSAGWSKLELPLQIGNLIYLSMITGRIPIIPPFTSHINEQASPLPYSDIFDVPRMVLALNTPILEWHMIKDLEHSQTPDARDELGCWNIWEVDNMQSTGPRSSYSTELLNLDISYTRAPASVKLIPNFEHDSHSTFWSLAKLAFPDGRAESLERPHENPTRPSSNGVTVPPDEQLPFEFERDYSPMWREVMVHAHWNAVPKRLAEEYLRHTFHLPDGALIPPFIAIHARRGDFLGWCGDVPKDDCFAPLGAFARRVREVQAEVRRRHGVYVPASRVVMTGDEKDARWWAAVEERGWRRLDHAGERTAERFGNWYPVILDAVVQSMAIGFVGTDRSTFSHMARRRVTDWNNGVVRLVKWGTVGADDH